MSLSFEHVLAWETANQRKIVIEGSNLRIFSYLEIIFVESSDIKVSLLTLSDMVDISFIWASNQTYITGIGIENLGSTIS